MRAKAEFFLPLERAWCAIAYEHYRYRYRGQEYEDSIPRHYAADDLSCQYQRAVAIGEPRPACIKLNPQQVKILDALAEAADIPH